MKSQMHSLLEDASLYNQFGTWRRLRREAYGNKQMTGKFGAKSTKAANRRAKLGKKSKALPYAAGDNLPGYPSLLPFKLRTTDDVIKAHEKFFADPPVHAWHCSKLGGGSRCSCAAG